MRMIKKGATDQSVVIRIVDSGDGTPETGVTSATSGLDLKYRREGATTTNLTESDLAGLDSAHSDGGMLHIGAGYYRIDLPDAACATGANGVLVFGTVTGMVVIGCYVPLVDFDPQDTVRLGLTALPNAAADAAGGLPISDAGGLDLDDLKADINTIDDFLDTEIAAIKAKTDNLPADPADASDIAAAFSALDAKIDTIDNFLDTEIAAILAAVDTEVAAIKAVTDLLVATDAEPTGVPAADETPLTKLAYVFMAVRNRIDVTATKKQFYDDGGAVEWEKDLSDDGVTYSESEGNAP